MDEDTNDVQDTIQQNTEFLSEVLRHSEDPYAQGCALVLLKYAGSQSDIEKVIQELEKCRQ